MCVEECVFIKYRYNFSCLVVYEINLMGYFRKHFDIFERDKKYQSNNLLKKYKIDNLVLELGPRYV